MDDRNGADAVLQRMREEGFAVKDAEVAGEIVSVGRRSAFRWQWVATRLHAFVFVVEAGGFSGQQVTALTAAAQEYAIDHKGGLPRGLQAGSAAIPLFVAPAATDTLRATFGQEPQHRFAALVFPALVETNEATITYFRGRMSKGHLYGGYLRQLVETLVAPAVELQDGSEQRR